MRSISIHGSCISRDLIEFTTSERIELKEYIARHSILSAVSNDIPLKKEEINLNSEFQKRLILIDFNKTLFTTLKENISDYIILDLIDERFDLLSIGDSMITCSNEFNASNLIQKFDASVVKRKDIDENIWMSAIDKYIDKLLDVYKQEQIIIHEAYFLMDYTDKDGNIKRFNKNITQNNLIYNNILNKYYNYIKKQIPNSNNIDISHRYSADELNKWGLAPYHYQKEYYKEILKIINKIIQ